MINRIAALNVVFVNAQLEPIKPKP